MATVPSCSVLGRFRRWTEKRSRGYSVYVLIWLTITYLINQMDRFLIGIVSKRLSRDLDFGTKGCLPMMETGSSNDTCPSRICQSMENSSLCDANDVCEWTYLGVGLEYQILAGPAFTIIFTLCAIPLGFTAGLPRNNRKVVLSVSIVLWSLMTLLSSFTHNFGQLLATRIGLGLFEAVCTPYATSMLADYFEEGQRGVALGVYNWGIYIGYSVTFLFEFILVSTDWRWTYRIASLLGFLVAVVVLLTVLEPKRRAVRLNKTACSTASAKTITLAFLNPALILLCIAGGVRQGAGLTLAYNIKPFVINEYCDVDVIGQFMSWVPLVGGTIGALIGGYVSDRLRRKAGRTARMWVLIISQAVATPFAVGVVMIPVPYNFLSFLVALIVGEMWIGVCLAIVIELLPLSVAALGIAFFLFVINNIGGCVTLLVPPLQAAIGIKYSLLILVPGSYAFAAILFLITFFINLKTLPCWRVTTSADVAVGEGRPDETKPLLNLPSNGAEDDFEESIDYNSRQEAVNINRDGTPSPEDYERSQILTESIVIS